MSPATRTMEDALAEVAEVAALRRERIGEANELYERQLDLMVELREGFEVQAKYREIAAAIEGTVVVRSMPRVRRAGPLPDATRRVRRARPNGAPTRNRTARDNPQHGNVGRTAPSAVRRVDGGLSRLVGLHIDVGGKQNAGRRLIPSSSRRVVSTAASTPIPQRWSLITGIRH